MTAVRSYARLVALSHSVFALPFAMAAAVLAGRHVQITTAQVALLIVCLVTARASAMGFNRIADRDVDARNPRTSGREIPRGMITVAGAWAFTLVNAAIFVVCAALLGRATLMLAPIALLVLWGYSLTKRFTPLSHLVLGVALGLAPTAVWIALTGTYGTMPLLLSVGVATWVAGFDILYACQDVEFDRAEGLRSIPAWLGLRRALQISAALHVSTVGCFAAVGGVAGLGWLYAAGVAVVAAVLVREHAIVSADDLSRLDKAFFDLNGYVAVVYFVCVAADVWIP